MRPFGPAPRPTWWGYVWLVGDTVLLFRRLADLRPSYQMEERWRRGDYSDRERPGGRTERASCLFRQADGWRLFL